MLDFSIEKNLIIILSNNSNISFKLIEMYV